LPRNRRSAVGQSRAEHSVVWVMAQGGPVQSAVFRQVPPPKTFTSSQEPLVSLPNPTRCYAGLVTGLWDCVSPPSLTKRYAQTQTPAARW
jgi:hypothetical protein